METTDEHGCTQINGTAAGQCEQMKLGAYLYSVIFDILKSRGLDLTNQHVPSALINFLDGGQRAPCPMGGNTQPPDGSNEKIAIRRLPSDEGFFWWRENSGKPWRMVQVVDFSPSLEDKAFMMTYDVQNHSWSGRSLRAWAMHFPIGEWIHVSPPKADITEQQPDHCGQECPRSAPLTPHSTLHIPHSP